jgi:hypothetical protein
MHRPYNNVPKVPFPILIIFLDLLLCTLWSIFGLIVINRGRNVFPFCGQVAGEKSHVLVDLHLPSLIYLPHLRPATAAQVSSVCIADRRTGVLQQLWRV